ncbi:hypothetical protein DITRI_Ditri01bG0143700 [Diplodiscus trichospermus]
MASQMMETKELHENYMKILEDLTTSAHQIQEQVLGEILMRNAGTEYLRGFLNGQANKQLFKRNVPIVTYEDIKPYIERIAKGETSDILLTDPITQFIQSTGTSGGQPKLIPLTAESFERRMIEPSLVDLVMKKTDYLSNWITDPGCKNAMSSILTGPNPELADSIEHICYNKSWEGIIKKLWPKTKCISSIITGSMSQYISLLEFYGGRIPLVSPSYASSEATFGINLKPLCKPSDASYTFLPNMAYFEFLPVNNNTKEKAIEFKFDGASAKVSSELTNEDGNVIPVDLADVKLGQCYEVVVTTLTGLYRYRNEDVLKVTGFHNNSPQFQFVERQNVILSIDLDKTSEVELLKAITNAKHILNPLGLVLTTYSSYSDTSSTPGRYVKFLELKMKASDNLPKLDSQDNGTTLLYSGRILRFYI